MPTQETRRKLPRQLSREDAVFNVSRVALLVAALGAGRYDLLDEATQDRIHQPVRSEIFNGLVPIMTAAKEGGAAASYLSGGGSTVAAFAPGRGRHPARRAPHDAGGHRPRLQRPQHHHDADVPGRAPGLTLVNGQPPA